ncbi:MAG: hypothetical protein WDZ51_05380 [Pirellulaceae bacterium]
MNPVLVQGMVAIFVVVIHICIFMVVLKVVSGELAGFGFSLLVALGSLFGQFFLGLAFAKMIGGGGFIVAFVFLTALLGWVVLAVYGVELKRAMLVGILYMVISNGIVIFMAFSGMHRLA